MHTDDEVNAMIVIASAAFGRLRGWFWDRIGIRLDKKAESLQSVVLLTLLYACETWAVNPRHAKRLNHFRTCCLKKLDKVARQASRHRRPEKDRDAECAYSSETGTIKLERPPFLSSGRNSIGLSSGGSAYSSFTYKCSFPEGTGFYPAKKILRYFSRLAIVSHECTRMISS